LTAPENLDKSRNGRFLNRVFTPDEQELIGRMRKFPDAVLWALWAGKEGAYKAVIKNNPDISSSPKRYRVKFLDEDVEDFVDRSGGAALSGLIETPAGEVSFRTFFTPRYVHCLAMAGACLPDEMLTFQVLCLQDPSDLSAALRWEAAERIAALLGVSPSVISIRRTRTPQGYGPPRVLVAEQETSIDISLSHDGHYGAFALRC
jgi:phosphopantetheinyl transferase (holo-ACP synthase)